MDTSVSPGASPTENGATPQENHPADQPLPAETAQKPPVTVLLVDDDPMVREIAQLMLMDFGCIVLAATDGAEAVDLFRAHNQEISLVFCDQIMPRMDGWQTLAALHAINPAIPVIMASGISQGREMNTGNPVQPRAYLAKPYTMEALRLALSQVDDDQGKWTK
jgi:two-component system, cell cycle sensor histidine kinase and response regulator CckA